METILFSIIQLLIFFLSVIAHEVAHGAMAERLGDPTARLAGRLSLNPIRHLDPIGSIVLPLILFLIGSPVLFGWAKPVPINPLNFRDKKWGEAKVSIAGPAINLLIAVVFGLTLRLLPKDILFLNQGIIPIFSFISLINFVLAFFNLVPIPPLDGSWILFSFLPPGQNNIKYFLQRYGFIILLLFLFLGGVNFLYYLSSSIFGLISGVGISSFL